MSKEILHQSSWATTSVGTPIALHSSAANSTAEKASPVLLIGGVHGDEPEGVRLAEELLAWLHKNNNSVVEPWILIPCLNVDGHHKNQRMNARGVDLNRNFPSSDWSAQTKGPRYYPGPTPGSELEVQAVVKLIKSHSPKLIIHFHSWEPCVVYTGSPGRKPAEILGSGTGYKVAEDIGYPTPGSLGQYGWLSHQIPVVCIEAQEGAPLDSIWPHFSLGLITLLQKGFG